MLMRALNAELRFLDQRIFGRLLSDEGIRARHSLNQHGAANAGARRRTHIIISLPLHNKSAASGPPHQRSMPPVPPGVLSRLGRPAL
jgi:hypothetical protein